MILAAKAGKHKHDNNKNKLGEALIDICWSKNGYVTPPMYVDIYASNATNVRCLNIVGNNIDTDEITLLMMNIFTYDYCDSEFSSILPHSL